MLTRLYVDNYRALVNAELTLGRRSLLMGSNGTGKSTFGIVLVHLQLVIAGQSKTDDIFTLDTLTRWQTVPHQRFEIDAAGPDGEYHYELVVEHRKIATPDIPRTRVFRELLTINSRPLFHFEEGTVRLFRDDHSAGPEYPFDWGRSALGTISARHDNQKLTWFLRWLQALTVIRPIPALMEDLIERDDFSLVADARNFAAWYHLASSGNKRGDRLGEGQVIIYPWTDLSTNAAKGDNRSCVESVGFPPRIESWKALWNVTIRCFSKVPSVSRATSGVCSLRKWP